MKTKKVLPFDQEEIYQQSRKRDVWFYVKVVVIVFIVYFIGRAIISLIWGI